MAWSRDICTTLQVQLLSPICRCCCYCYIYLSFNSNDILNNRSRSNFHELFSSSSTCMYVHVLNTQFVRSVSESFCSSLEVICLFIDITFEKKEMDISIAFSVCLYWTLKSDISIIQRLIILFSFFFQNRAIISDRTEDRKFSA